MPLASAVNPPALLAEIAAVHGRAWIEGGKLRVEAPVGAIGEDLRARIAAGRATLIGWLGGAGGDITAVPRTASQAFPLSLSQHAFFMLDQLDPGNAGLNIVSLRRIRGALNVAAFEWAVAEVARRHETLRTRFAMQGGRPVQLIDAAAAPCCFVRDLANLDPAARARVIEDLTARRTSAGFSLRDGGLFRIDLFLLGPREFVTSLRMHHIVSDAASIEIFYAELVAFYRAFRAGRPAGLPGLAIQYADYAAWQDRLLAAGAFDRHVAFWREALDHVPALLPMLRPNPEPGSGVVTCLHTPPAGTRQALASIARAANTTIFVVLLALFQWLLARWTRHGDIPVIVPVSGRTRAELGPLIGLFVTGIVLRTRIVAAERLDALCRRVAATLSDALDHQDISVESLEGLTRQSRQTIPGLATLSKIAFNHIAVSAVGQDGDALDFETLASDRTDSVFDLMLVSIDGPDGMSFKLELREGLFAPDQSRRLLRDFTGLVEAACHAGHQAPLADLAPRPEREILAGLGAEGGALFPLAGWQARLAGPLGHGMIPTLAVTRPADAPGQVVARLHRLLALRPSLAARLVAAPAPLDAAYLVTTPTGRPVLSCLPSGTAGCASLSPLDGHCLFDAALIDCAEPTLVLRVSRLLASPAEAEAFADFLCGRLASLPEASPQPNQPWSAAESAAEPARLPPGPPSADEWAVPGDLLDDLNRAAARHGRTAHGLLVGLCAAAISAELGVDTKLLVATSTRAASGVEQTGALSIDLRSASANAPASTIATLVQPASPDPCMLIWFADWARGSSGAAHVRLLPPMGGIAIQLRRAEPGLTANARLPDDATGTLGVACACGISAHRLLRRIAHLACQVAADDPALAALDLLCPGEPARIVPNGSLVAGRLDPIEALRARAQVAPGAPCLAAAGGTLSYAEVARRAGLIATALLGASNSGGTGRVAVMMERGEGAVLALLGILAAGLTYVPIDPALPDGPIASLVERVRPDVVLVGPTIAARGQYLFGALCRALPDGPSDGIPPALKPCGADTPAYIMFTSGSTGTPKGVVVGRAALASFLAAAAAAIPLGPGDRFLALSSTSFDISLLEILLPLARGAILCVAPAAVARDGQALGRMLADTAATHLQATPSLWRLLLEAGWSGRLRTALTGGEALSPSLARQLLDRSYAVFNLYGPTEATIWCCAARIDASGAELAPPIGWPLANTHAYVADALGRPLPPGTEGELLIAGDTLALAYMDDPERTARAFAVGPGGERAYRTGDIVRLTEAGLVWLGRRDRQVKLRGHRIELGGIESVLRAQPGVTHAAAVVACPGTPDAAIVAYVAGVPLPDVHALRNALREALPSGSLPQRIEAIARLPILVSGKIDMAALQAQAEQPEPPLSLALKRASLPIERQITEMWRELLGHDAFSPADSFFDVGGQSILVVRLRDLIRDRLGADLQVVDLFENPRIPDLAHLVLKARSGGKLERLSSRGAAQSPAPLPATDTEHEIAIIGMAGRFPGAPDLDTYWRNLATGVISIAELSDAQLLEAGLDPAMLRQPGYVRAAAMLDDAEAFDAACFRLSPREAALMDPQHRLLLQCSLGALEDAGYAAQVTGERIGVFAGVGFPSYFFTNIQFDRTAMTEVSPFALLYANEKDYAVAQIAYRLDLRGPCVTVATACSTGLVAVHQACRSLLNGECEVALAGAAKVMTPQTRGYLHSPGGILSPDGACRPFDSAASGTVFGSGVAALLLKPLGRALADGDAIHAVIRGSAVNNDGAGKIGLTAPSRRAQAEVLADALRQARVTPDTIGFIEAHGTGTALGDPIELSAICDAYGIAGRDAPSCVIGAVKANIGHLDPVAGLAGLIKAVLSLKHRQIPPNPRYSRPNPAVSLSGTRFVIGDRLTPWEPAAAPRRAGVSAFGIGGTNAHVVLEEAPDATPPGTPRRASPPCLLPVSGHSPAALDRQRLALATRLQTMETGDLPAIAATLQLGRAPRHLRRCIVAATISEAVEKLRGPSRDAAACDRPLVLLFAGQQGRIPGGYAALLDSEPVFAGWIARCAEPIADAGGPQIQAQLRQVAVPGAAVADTGLEQPCLFAVEFALAKTLESFGLTPAALLGHSLGELAAAAFAGVMALEDAARLVVKRGALMQACPPGAMAAIHAPLAPVTAILGACEVAARNAEALTIIAGAPDDVAATLSQARLQGYRCSTLPATRAFHSRAMAPARDALHDCIAGLSLRPPQLGLMSGFTGAWLTDAEATDPAYWAGQLCRTVAFDDGLRALLATPQLSQVAPVFLEIGAGEQLAPLARRLAPQESLVLSTARAPRPDRAAQPDADLAGALARLWESGQSVDWCRVREGKTTQRVHLPGTSFEPTRHWIAPNAGSRLADPTPDQPGWIHEAVWEIRRPIALPEAAAVTRGAWLLLGDGSPLQLAVATGLRSRIAEPAILDLAALDTDGGPAALAARLGDAVAALPPSPGPVRLIVFPAASIGTTPPDMDALTGLDRLIGLARAIGLAFRQRSVQLAVASHRLFSTSAEETTEPLAALALGPVRGLGREMGNLRAAAICLGAESGADWQDCSRLAGALIAECAAGLPEAEVALRGPRRLVSVIREAPLPADPGAGPEMLLGGGRAFLLTGGLGDLGFALAQRLASRHRASLLIVGRRAAESEAVRRRLASLREAGGTVAYVAGNCAVAETLDQAVQAAHECFGRLDGAFHLAGTADGRLLDFRTAAHTREVAAAKALGGLHLSRLARHHGWSSLVFYASITARLASTGQLVYAAANAVLDSLAQSNMAQGIPCRSIAWDAWRDIGMAQRAAAADLLGAARAGGLRAGLSPEDGLNLLDRLLLYDAPCPIVCTNGWSARLAAEAALDLPRRAGASLPRPAAEPDQAPAGPDASPEQALADLWRRCFGLPGVGPDDDFFDLGGNSLMAVNLLPDVERILGASLSADIFMRAPTIRRLVEAASGAVSRSPHMVALRVGAQTQAQSSGPLPAWLVLVHPIGGEVLVYRDLVANLAPGRDVLGLRNGGRDAAHRRYASVADMAAAYAGGLRAIAGCRKLFLAGASFGGAVALEMARQLAEAGDAAPDLAGIAMIDTPLLGDPVAGLRSDDDILAYLGSAFADDATRDRVAATLAASAHPAGDTAAERPGPSMPGAADAPELATILEVFRYNQGLMSAYRPGRADFTGLNVPVHFIKAAERRPAYDPPAPETAWRDILPGMTLHLTGGNHVTMHSMPHAAQLARLLDRIMEGSDPDAVPSRLDQPTHAPING